MVDIPANSTTTSVLRVGDTLSGLIEIVGDHDWYRLTLSAGQSVRIDLSGTGVGPVSDTYLELRNSSGALVASNDDSNGTLNSSLNFTATVAGTYYVDVSAFGSATGAYQVSVSSLQAPANDIPADASTTASLVVGGSASGSLEVTGDHDWYRLSLTAGQEVRIDLSGFGATPVDDTYLRIRDANGNILYENDDVGSSLNSSVAFRATTTGVFFVDVGSYDDQSSGGYQVSVSAFQMPPEFTFAQIADQLVSGYWAGDTHRFNVSPGGSLTVNISALTAAGQTLARAALAQWTDIIGVRFVEVTSGGQLTFDDNESGAFTEATWASGITSRAHVNVSTEWLADYGSGLNTYSFQTYIHEIGHALGLGHAGNYNGDAAFPYDALFRNDSWAATVMSYFSQADNTFISGQGFQRNLIATPMIGDILAMQQLYGLSTTTRLGDTLYGPSWSSSMGAITLFDSGGIDTIDVTAFGGAQRVDLTPGSYSNVLGEVGTVGIAFGTSIENVISGAGDDELIGNGAANFLSGGGGNDILRGGAGNDVLNGGAGNDAVEGGDGDDRIVYDAADDVSRVSGGSGVDTLVVDNIAAPTGFNLSSRGFEAAEVTTRDGGGNVWSSIVQLYNASWQMTQQITVNDDASRVIIDFDPANQVSTRQVWNTFDSQNRLSSVDQLFDNGTRIFINLDETNSQSFAQNWFSYDAQGRLDTQDVHYDNGTRTFINFDQAGNQSFNQDWFTYDAQGRLDSQDVHYDNGTRTFINFDQDNSQPWSQAWFTYDAQGRLDTQDVIGDDGSRTFYNYDQDNSQIFQVSAILYNASGVAYQQVTSWDDGSRTYTAL